MVHEAWIRLAGQHNQHHQNRHCFFDAAAEVMRRILVDRARRRQADRHGGELEQVGLDVTGTIGQHDAGGPMTGGSYSLTGGFWR